MKLISLRIACLLGLAAVSGIAQEVIPLYSGDTPGAAEGAYPEKQYFSKIWNTEVVANVTKRTLTVYKPGAGAGNGAAVVVFPGADSWLSR